MEELQLPFTRLQDSAPLRIHKSLFFFFNPDKHSLKFQAKSLSRALFNVVYS